MDIRISKYSENEAAIRDIRYEVFIQEQNVPEEAEFDGSDEQCVHVIVLDEGNPIGTGRLAPDGRIGRMAVKNIERGKGVGKAIIQALEQHAIKNSMGCLWANAQVHAIGFYEKQGYQATGKVFMEAGIPHKRIYKTI